jgi:HAD superfamily hydrolase (TIGR01509 family)
LSSGRALRFEGLIFDMGDILYDASVWRRWLAGELQRHGLALSFGELVAQWEALLVDVYRGQAAYWDRFDALLRAVGLAEEAHPALREAARRKAEEVQLDRRPMDGVPETLAALHAAGVKLAVLSDNESGSRQVRRVLDQLGLDACFDAVLTSAEIGQVKPHPDAFAEAVSALGLPAEHCAFVGHDVDELEGAQRAGLFAIAYNYDPAAPADVRLAHFSQLEQVVLDGDGR